MKIEGFPYEASVCGEDRAAISEKDGGYVPLAHGEKYFIKLKNDDSRRALVEVTADGVPLGKWVIPAGFDGSTLIERPQHQANRLTFFQEGSSEAKAALLDTVSPQNLGLLQFTFTRERPPRPVSHGLFLSWSGRESFGSSAKGLGESLTRGGGGLSAGGTGLTGQSAQVFGRTTFDPDPDFDPIVISLRLVCDPERQIPMGVTPLAGHRPRANEVPAPIRK